MKWSRVAVAAAFAILTTVRASEIPVARPPAICGLKVTAAGADGVLLRWTGGTPPFVVLRSEAADFTAARDVRVLAAGVASREYRDRVGRGQAALLAMAPAAAASEGVAPTSEVLPATSLSWECSTT
mgnify:FL=1